MRVVYNENRPPAVAALKQMIVDGHVAPGEVDDRSIRDVGDGDYAGYGQVHLFAGGGFWSAALRMAGWPDDRPVWTGSCPCQPFSAAGRRQGVADARHLWPEMFRLVRQCGPSVVLGEQVAGRAGWVWFDAVSGDLEAARYAVGAAGLTACGFGAPHIRERIYWMALADDDGRGAAELHAVAGAAGAVRRGATRGLAHAQGGGRGQGDTDTGRRGERSGAQQGAGPAGGGGDGRLGHSKSERLFERTKANEGRRLGSFDATGGKTFWSNPEWVYCSDRGGVWRPIEPGTFPLADGRPGRAAVLHLAGNAIVLPVAAAFARVVLDEIETRENRLGQLT